MSVAIVTGASTGLGAHYVEAIVKERPEIGEIWLVARNAERLKKVAAKYPERKFKTISADLADYKTAYAKLEAILEENKPDISLIVQDAGGFLRGDFDQLSFQTQVDLINLNSIGAIAVPHVCLPYMKSGEILLVCSTSSFGVQPHLIVYCATKIFLRFISVGMRYELKDRGRNINVCAVHPGYMDTEMTAGDPAAPSIPRVDQGLLASNSLKAAKRGDAEYTEGAKGDFYIRMGELAKSSSLEEFAVIMDTGHKKSQQVDDMTKQ